jgi:hypothetical protein
MAFTDPADEQAAGELAAFEAAALSAESPDPAGETPRLRAVDRP